jgi:UDP-N-acetyl-D-glucosamine/UDP-N-acetyl-D-galactosamine dehydrogenase
VVDRISRLMTRKKIHIVDSRILVMGLTFKEDCPDLRNTRVIDIVREFQSLHATVDVHDPWVDAAEAQHEYGITPVAEPQPGSYDAIILAVAHRQFRELGAERIHGLGKPNHVLFDVKYLLPATDVDGRL